MTLDISENLALLHLPAFTTYTILCAKEISTIRFWFRQSVQEATPTNFSNFDLHINLHWNHLRCLIECKLPPPIQTSKSKDVTSFLPSTLGVILASNR